LDARSIIARHTPPARSGRCRTVFPSPQMEIAVGASRHGMIRANGAHAGASSFRTR
jgi:hypothetical protein